MRPLLLALIRLYQRHLSPRKGYGCAYRLHCGGAGCSGLGFRAIRWKGSWTGLWLLRERLARCAAVHAQAHPQPRSQHRPPALQRGDCDCGGCDLPGAGGGDACDLGDTCDCCDACDVFDRKSRREQRRKAFRGRFS